MLDPVLHRVDPIAVGREPPLDAGDDRILRPRELVGEGRAGGEVGDDLAGDAEEGRRPLRPDLGRGVEDAPVGEGFGGQAGGVGRIGGAFLLAQPVEQPHLEHVGGERQRPPVADPVAPAQVDQPISA